MFTMLDMTLDMTFASMRVKVMMPVTTLKESGIVVVAFGCTITRDVNGNLLEPEGTANVQGQLRQVTHCVSFVTHRCRLLVSREGNDMIDSPPRSMAQEIRCTHNVHWSSDRS